jgi:hypothetical protein
MIARHTITVPLVTLALLASRGLKAQYVEPASVDSVVLERTLCFGVCPAYRLSLTRAGSVHFESRNPGDSGRIAFATIPTADFQNFIALGLASTAFFALPDRIRDEPKYCGNEATDHPTVTVTLYAGARVKRVEDYLGCMWAPVALRAFEDRIDQAAQSSRWVRLARGPR